MPAEFLHYDEKFVDGDGNTYLYLLTRPTGGLGSVSSSPFAPKSTTGDRSYADYDAISAIAFTDFSGGMGQDRMTDATKYYDGVCIDTRGTALTLGPKQYSTNQPYAYVLGDTYQTISGSGATGVYSAIAQRVSTPVDMTASAGVLRCVWLFLKGDHGAPTIPVKLYDSALTTVLATGYIAAGTLKATGAWVCATFTTAAAGLTGNAPYYISVENSDANYAVYWLGYTGDLGVTPTASHWTGSAWAAHNGAKFNLMFDDYQLRPDSPPYSFVGAGADGVTRVWARAGRSLYYYGATGTPTAALASAGGAVKLVSADIVSHAWYRGKSDTQTYLYLALGNSTPIERFNASIGAESWLTMDTVSAAGANRYATCLAVHDNLLAYAYDQNKVDFFDGALWGYPATGASTGYASVGGREYPVRNMVSWNGNLWVGKDDGLYKVTNAVGYPAVTGNNYAQKIIDLLSVADSDNFRTMLVYQGDLYFNIGSGLARYTTGNVFQSIAPDTALNITADKRLTYVGGVASLNNVFVLGQASTTVGADGTVENGTGQLLSYADAHWTPLASIGYTDNQLMTNMCIDPGWYGEQPRLWYGVGLTLRYVEMPTMTQRRWLVPGVHFSASGDWYSSWIDGNIRTIEKDWLEVELVTHDSTGRTSTDDDVSVYWRKSGLALDDASSWELLGTVDSAAGATSVAFPVASHSTRCQLWIRMTSASPYTTTPRIEAAVLKYMERPTDVRAHTRMYKLADRNLWRNGLYVTQSLAEQLDQLRTLRELKEPLTWYSWYGGTAKKVHIVDYTVTELPDEDRETGDKGAMMVVLRLQEVD